MQCALVRARLRLQLPTGFIFKIHSQILSARLPFCSSEVCVSAQVPRRSLVHALDLLRSSLFFSLPLGLGLKTMVWGVFMHSCSTS